MDRGMFDDLAKAMLLGLITIVLVALAIGFCIGYMVA